MSFQRRYALRALAEDYPQQLELKPSERQHGQISRPWVGRTLSLTHIFTKPMWNPSASSLFLVLQS